MLRRRSLSTALAATLLSFLSLPALAQVDGESITPGNTCNGTPGQADKAEWDTFFECNSGSHWQRGPYFFGSTADTCDSNHAGMVQWTGSGVSPNNTFEFCNGSTWTTVNGAASFVALSGITAATGSNTMDSGANAQTWKWGTLTSGTALTLTTSSMTGGTLLSLQDTAASATSTGKVLSSAMTGHGTTVYAGYFTNTDTGNDANYAVYASSASPSGWGVYGANSAGGGTGVEGVCTGGGACAGVYGSGSGGNAYGGYFSVSNAAGNGEAVAGTMSGTGNTGYGGYFSNASATGANYGVAGSVASGSGYGGYFTNTSTGFALAATGTSYFNGSVGIGTTSPTRRLSVVANNSTGGVINFENTNSSGWSSFDALDSSGIQQGGLGYGNSGTSAPFTGTVYVASTSVPLTFITSNSAAMTITTTQSVGIGTTSPADRLDVNGGVKIGADSNTCSSSIKGAVRYNSTSNLLEFCNGAAWTPLEPVQSTPVETAPSGSGYFVMSGSTYDGNLYGSYTGPNSLCLTDLTTNTGWQGYATANSRGLLTSAHVFGFFCDAYNQCNNLMPLTTYYFANAANSSAGGAYFTTDSGGLGPNDNANWAAANYFGGNYSYFVNRTYNSSTQWANNVDQQAGNSTCNLFSSNSGSNYAEGGQSAYTDQNRWDSQGQGCTGGVHLICFVNP